MIKLHGAGGMGGEVEIMFQGSEKSSIRPTRQWLTCIPKVEGGEEGDCGGVREGGGEEAEGEGERGGDEV